LRWILEVFSWNDDEFGTGWCWMESSPVATMNNSIFFLVNSGWAIFLLGDHATDAMIWFRFTWGSRKFLRTESASKGVAICGLYFVGKFQEFGPKFVQIQYRSFSLFWIKLFQVKIYWKNIDHIWAIYIILTIYLFQNEWICIYICIYTY
jgi:hypothetical protein